MGRYSDWTPELEEQLTLLWIQETPLLSTVVIGMRLGMTKNKVIGKARRMGLPLRKQPPRNSLTKRPRHMINLPKPPRIVLRKKPEAPVIEPIPGGLHILDLTGHHCRAIIGHGSDGLARYCGATVAQRERRFRGTILTDADGHPEMRNIAWCDGHANIYFDPRNK